MFNKRTAKPNFWTTANIPDPELRLFYIYLAANERVTQCGVYLLDWQEAQETLHINRQTIQSYLAQLEDSGHISYSERTGEVMLNSWLERHQRDAKKIARTIDWELIKVRTPAFEAEVIKKCHDLNYPILTLAPKQERVWVS